jgi:ATP-dependent Clp protease ATP-binding subunit ClpC
MFERFTDRSRRVVVLAQEEARMLGHNHIGTEHLLLGLIHEQSGSAAQVLKSAGITIDAARAEVGEIVGPGGKPLTRHIPFTQRAKKVLELSLREALEQKKSYIAPEHILLGLTRDPGGVGAQILERLGGPLSALRQQVIEAARAAPPDPAAEREGGPEPWAAEWPPAQGSVREARVQPQTVIGFRMLLSPIERRLADIERHLGITAEYQDIVGFRGLLMSVNRHLSNIERHLGIAADAEAEAGAEAAEETGEEGPAAGAQ